MQSTCAVESATTSHDNIQIETLVRRLNAAMARYSTLESEWLAKDITTRRDIRQLDAADTVLLTGALEHRPSENNFGDGHHIPKIVLTTVIGYKNQMELIPVVPSSYKILAEAAAAIETCAADSEFAIIDKATKLIGLAHALVDDLEVRVKQRVANVSRSKLPALTEVQLLNAWNLVCESYQRDLKLDECIDKAKQQLKSDAAGGGGAAGEPVEVTKFWFKYDSANYEPRTWKDDFKKRRY